MFCSRCISTGCSIALRIVSGDVMWVITLWGVSKSHNKMCEECERYQFNGQKSQFMTFTGSDCRKATGNVMISGDAIHATCDSIYLGVILTKQEG